MRSMQLLAPADAASRPLALVDRPIHEPGADEVLVKVEVCGVCRTDLHVVEGELAPQRPAVVPGHQVVGRVERAGSGVGPALGPGARVGVAWLHRSCGRCRFCARGDENLCVAPRFTGWDQPGGFAELAVVDEQFAYRIPDTFDDLSAAPLLCAGIIGFRSLRRAALPAGGRLGIYGFGASAHLAAQVALHEGAELYVMTRSEAARRLAGELGATWVGGADEPPPNQLDAAILFAPVGDLVPPAMRALDRGGTLAIAGIHLSDIPPLHYATELFQERQIRSVTANTRADGEEFLHLAAQIPIRPTVTPYPFDQVDRALDDLSRDRVEGAAVISLLG